MKRRTKIATGVLLALAVGAGWHIHRWGQPVPRAYERVAAGRYRLLASAATVYVAEDIDGDGTIDRVYPEGAPARGFPRPAATDADARWLIVCLDGVPYAEMKALWEEGYFREFFAPSELVAPFPSDSESALTDLFHAAPVPGYEHRYFSRAANRLRGGMTTTFTEEHIPYLALLDYDMGGFLKGLTYILPRKSYRADLGRLRRRFLESNRKVFLAHIASTDSLYHVLTREEMRALLIEVDALLRDLYFAAGGKLRITLLSDHGNSLEAPRSFGGAVPLRAFLAERGWRLTDSLRQPRDVVVPAYGLVGFLAAYSQPNTVAELARTLAEMEGVDLAVWASDGSVVIESRRGRARLDWSRSFGTDARQFRYRPESGDPLELAPLLAELARTGKVSADGYIADADLFAATARHRYPDSAYRLWQWATNHVLNRADVLVSLAPGYHYGRETFQRIVTLRSTHGSLDRAQSVGFAMSTDASLPTVLRGRDLLPEKMRDLTAAGKTKPKTRGALPSAP